MTFHVVGSFPLGGFNIAAEASAGFLAPALAQFDLMLNGPFGLGSVGAQIGAQFDGSVSAELNIGLQLSNPFANVERVLGALAQIEAALLSSLNLQIPTVQITAQLQANISLQAVLGVKLAGIQALIAGALAVKLPAVDFLATLAGSLAAGPVIVASWGFVSAPETLFATGAEIGAAFSLGFGGLLPTDIVYGVMVVTKEVSASVGISATLLVA